MAKYKITCENPSWCGQHYHGVQFKGVGYTTNGSVAQEFANKGLTSGGKPMFTVEEVTEEAE